MKEKLQSGNFKSTVEIGTVKLDILNGGQSKVIEAYNIFDQDGDKLKQAYAVYRLMSKGTDANKPRKVELWSVAYCRCLSNMEKDLRLIKTQSEKSIHTQILKTTVPDMREKTLNQLKKKFKLAGGEMVRSIGTSIDIMHEQIALKDKAKNGKLGATDIINSIGGILKRGGYA